MTSFYIAVLLSALADDGTRITMWAQNRDESYGEKATCEHVLEARRDLLIRSVMAQFSERLPRIRGFRCLTLDEIQERNLTMGGTEI